MSGSIFNLLNNGRQSNQNNSSGNSFLNFVNQIRQNGISPEQTVRQLINSGRMTQEQFNQLGAMANQILGNSRQN